MKKNVFILSMFIYMLVFNILILNTIGKNGAINNALTGNVVGLGSNPAADPRVMLPLFAFNLGIIGLFIMSYYSYNTYKMKAKHHRA